MFLLVLGAVALVFRAQVAQPADSPAPESAQTKTLSPEDLTQYVRLTRNEMELQVQLKLLSSLSDEHLKRSEDASRANASEKTKWENDLAQELRDKGSVLLSQLNELSKQRLAFESTRGQPSSSALGTGALNQAKPLTPDELAYVTKLDERLLKVRQDLAQAVAAGRDLSSELQTNVTAETVGRISLRLEQNNRLEREYEREQSDLELRVLAFRATRK